MFCGELELKKIEKGQSRITGISKLWVEEIPLSTLFVLKITDMLSKKYLLSQVIMLTKKKKS